MVIDLEAYATHTVSHHENFLNLIGTTKKKKKLNGDIKNVQETFSIFRKIM